MVGEVLAGGIAQPFGDRLLAVHAVHPIVARLDAREGQYIPSTLLATPNRENDVAELGSAVDIHP